MAFTEIYTLLLYNIYAEKDDDPEDSRAGDEEEDEDDEDIEELLEKNKEKESVFSSCQSYFGQKSL